MSLKKCLIATLLIFCLTPMLFAQEETEETDLLSKEEILFIVKPDLYYAGWAVQEFAFQIIEQADLAIQDAYLEGMEAGAAEATRQLLPKIKGLEAWKSEAKKIRSRSTLANIGIIGAAALAAALTGYLLGTAH